MNTPHPFDSDNNSGVTKQVGPDRVFVSEECIVIQAAQAMDWPAREFSRIPIYFEGRKYYVRSQHEAPPPYAKCYELWPWPADLHEESNRVVVYSESYVTNRDKTTHKQQNRELLHILLLPFYPFLGLFWSRFKDRTFPQLAFATRSITSASIMLVFGLLIVEAIFVGWLRTGILVWVCRGIWFRNLDWVLMALLALDTVLRYNQSMNLDTQRHWGFCEWLWPGKRRED